MDYTKKILKIIDVCLAIGIFLYINVGALNLLLDGNSLTTFVNELIQNRESIHIKELLFLLLFCYGISIITFLFTPLGFAIVMYIAVRIINRHMIQKNKKHPKFDMEYFRDDLDKISPAYISYLINFEIDINTDVPAHILKLELDGYIKEENSRLVVTNKDQSTLAKSDKIILNIVKNNFQNLYELKQYKIAVTNEMIELGYIKRRLPKNIFFQAFGIILIVNLLSFFSISFFMIGKTITGFSAIVFFICMLMNILGPMFLIIFIFAYSLILRKKGNIKRTNQGNELLEKIYGLKNFLSDFTNVDNSRLQDIELREYYLVYAVVLDINDIAEDEMLQKIKQQINQ